MNKKLQEKVLNLTRKLKDKPNARNKHFTFIIRNNRVVASGTNDCWTSHTLANRLGYRFSAIHSELDAYLKIRKTSEKINKCILVNTRINSKSEIGYSKPCKICTKLIKDMGIKKVYFTNREGKIERFICQ